ncbi:hypothetical protein CO112_02175 [Candidatus Dojkabacteria bacterium CG_4_9_14_3_um_filter_150_Dojkabacteria_WS6_41_13]|uniref:Short-chain dehydrogenase n=1 Tax=Candidatus Dojkabacteria bacterium CG_4_10_14_0_2_um_filter_Dojkabacteria_WS6_41_15 TaxID=2014249 RepID=A0A2M7W2U7_9BACT|nr:MAG: hypothetical protein COZ14_04300 [Candidatus Dojkabacteria bacterium CG_4_10_14_3_um_filter_Dojkabacteria_WS6_41_9]PJA15402.1 MAG: hypothetical protein COX64_00820 [Candidatus Dojkabacteria bacterium CG_4_10_14_0_2_um_filter_Dojkabacteria_WS6_41_15]PJB22855.1 MAG: hypothetical protein CO112_02175 [Candidatus Dojkabacteria bacterium CG_4_9_14_3_um_filter_150_Dojkabacteria_WS6_41_13]
MKTAIVTGATSDIGQAIISELLTNNYQVIAIGRDENKLNLLQNLSTAIVAKKIDLSDLSATIQLANELLTNYTKIDTFIHCAAIWHTEESVLAGIDYCDFSEKQVLDTLNVGLVSPMLLIRALIPKFVVNSSIIFLTGTFSNGGKGWIPYFVSKRATEDLVIGLSDELKTKHITVNAISPADTNTAAYRKFFPNDLEGTIDTKSIASETMTLVDGLETGIVRVLRKNVPTHDLFHSN